MFLGRKWTTINDNGGIEVLNPQEVKYNPDIEKYTDYRYTTGQKVSTIVDEVAEEAKQDISSVGDFVGDLGTGLKNGAKVFKYLPFIALGLTVYMITKPKVKHGRS